jgi:hypothetical protein
MEEREGGKKVRGGEGEDMGNLERGRVVGG